MTDDELLLIYKGLRDMTEAMKAREIVLDQKTAALDGAIAQLQQLPPTLGKQTSQYIAMGVRQSIQDDFSRPIAEAVKAPLSEFSYATRQARDVMREVGKESRYQTWGWVAIIFVLGIAVGVTGIYFFFQRDIGRIDDRLDTIHQQVTLAVPAPDGKPAIAPSTKGHHGSHPAVAPSAP